MTAPPPSTSVGAFADRDRLPLSVRSAAFYLEPPVVLLPADVELAEAANKLMLGEDPPANYGFAMDAALAADPKLAERYARRYYEA